jgi:hypothetical protein
MSPRHLRNSALPGSVGVVYSGYYNETKWIN